ncbi:hypothetical protein Tsubulata_012047 [Turnera subulata]|uniref:SKP1 component POZ domain-containing protein n=1 Tax=Turnera subulata TaxID=218843 RepID=A0A9Q0GH37_9ROSI|nr:hypothetical protein Tsubulata_012047 [Turnera subulata]
MIEGGYTDGSIPLPYITGRVLRKVIEYCKKHGRKSANNEEKKELKVWDAEFVKAAPAALAILMMASYLTTPTLI